MNNAHRQPHLTVVEGFIPRPALVAQLLGDPASGFDRGLTVLTAPGGYGKTWLVRQVAQAWSSLRPAMPVRVWSVQSSMTIMQALRSFCALYDEHDIAASLSLEAVTDAALAAIAGAEGPPGLLIVDIDGAPPSKAVQSLIGQILLESAVRGRCVIACRSPWALPVDRIAMMSPLKIFRATQLAMSTEEIAVAQSLALADAHQWWRLTEGWPVICGGSSRWRGNRAAAHVAEPLADALVGMFADYMEHELLAPLPPRDVRLLMQVSLFDAIEPGVFEALELGAPWSRLAGLVESGLPLASDRSDWDRVVIHPLFRRFLQRRLLARAPVLHHVLHRRAAHYFAAAGSFRDAMLHATQTGDPVFEAQITERSGGWRISWREGLHALGGGTAPPMELSGQYPKAALARIYWQAQTGRIDEARAALDRLHAQQPGETLRSDLLSIDAVIAIYRDAPFDETRVQQLADLRQRAGEDEPLLFPSGATLQAAMLNNAGLYDCGASTARVAILEAEALSSHYVEFYGQLQYALALHGLGRIVDANAPYQRARALGQEIFGETSGECRMIGLLIAHAAWLAGRDEQAECPAGDLDGLYRLHAWFDPYARVLQIAAAISRSRGDRALEDRVLEDFADLATRRSLPRLKIAVQLARAQQALAQHRIDLAELACEATLKLATEEFPTRTATAACVLAPVWLEKARIALTAGRFEDATRALIQVRHWSASIRNGALDLEAALLEAYVALRGRRYREVSRLLAQCVNDAERSGLRRPFLGNATLVMEMVGYARAHALNLDATTLRRAAEFAQPEAAAAPAGARKIGAASGRLLLTERETDILHGLAEGLSTKEMARRLAIAAGTIKTHRKHLYEKLDACARSQAIVKARELGLL